MVAVPLHFATLWCLYFADMLQLNPAKRLTIDQVLGHRFLGGAKPPRFC